MSNFVKICRQTLFCALLFALFANFGHANTVSGTITTPNTSVGVSNGTLTFNLNQAATVVGSFSVAASSVVCATSTDGSVVGLPNPTIVPIVALGGAAGSLSGTYYVKVTYYASGVETLASPAYVATLSGPNTQIIVSAPVLQPSAATGYKVYVSAAGGALGTETLQATTVGWGTTTINTVSAGAALPSSNTSVCSLAFNDTFIPYGTWYNVSLSDTNGTPIGGFPQRWVLQGASVNLANGFPLANVANSLRFPTALILNPSSNAQQSINSSVTLNGYSFTAGAMLLSDNAAPPACAAGRAVIWENSSHKLQACQNGGSSVAIIDSLTNGWTQNGTDVRLSTFSNSVLIGLNASDLTTQGGGASTGVKVGTFDYYIDTATNAHVLAVGMLASPNNYAATAVGVIGNGVSGTQMNGVPLVFIGCKVGDSCTTYGLTEFGRMDVGGQWHLGALPASTTEDTVTGAVMTRGGVSITNGGSPSGVNMAVLKVTAVHGLAILNTAATGTETPSPLAFQINGTELARFTNSGGASFIPGADVSQALGSPSNRWQNLYVGNFEILGASTTDVSFGNPAYACVGSACAFVSTSATANASTMSMSAVSGTYAALSSSHTAAGTTLPLAFFLGATEVANFPTVAGITGSMLLGATTSDLSDNNAYIAIGNGSGFVSATATSNASTFSAAVVSGSYAALSSSKTGSGTYLPLAFFASGGEVARFPTPSTVAGSMLLGGTTTDINVTGTPFFVTVGNGTGFASVSASANASVLSFSVIGGSYAAIGSQRTGAGAFLPIAMFVNNQQRMSIDLTSNAVCVWVGGALHRLTLSAGAFVDGGAC